MREHEGMVRFVFFALSSAVAGAMKAAVDSVDSFAAMTTTHCTRG
ncbi:hypothetical protein ACFU99_23825 [Streptomyces sp. NPDC057654]